MDIILKNVTKDTRNVYLHYLINQFQESAGEKYNNPLKKENLKEFELWLKERQNIKENYKMLLDYMKIEYNHPITVEIGKGLYDTVTYNKKTTIITPYTYGLNKNNHNKIIKANIKIVTSSDIESHQKILPIDSVMTENPYTENHIHNWEYLLNSSKFTTTIGIYGKIYDKDYGKKIKILETLKEKIIDEYNEELIRVKDDYIYIISSNKMIRQRAK